MIERILEKKNKKGWIREKKENKRIYKNNKREGKLIEKEKGYFKYINWWFFGDREDCIYWEWLMLYGFVLVVWCLVYDIIYGWVFMD